MQILKMKYKLTSIIKYDDIVEILMFLYTALVQVLQEAETKVWLFIEEIY
jgi:hypothetical protein